MAKLPKEPNPYAPQAGMWTLTAPDGRQWQADSPLKCAGLEQKSRIPATVRLQRLMDAAAEDTKGEPCYCGKCNGRNSVCPYVIRNFWRTVKCWITLNHIDPAVRGGRCKRCGMKVLS